MKRLGFDARIRAALSPDIYLPAIAQGALGIEYQTARSDVAAWLAPFANEVTTAMVNAERAFGRALTASCDVPLGASATLNVDGNELTISGFVATPDGLTRLAKTMVGSIHQADALGVALAEALCVDGADRILADLAAAAHRTGAPLSIDNRRE